MSRQAPSIHASENPIGLIKKGNNGEYWIIIKSGNNKKWVMLGKYKKYKTIDNGSIKYTVIFSKTKILVFENVLNSINLKKNVLNLKKIIKLDKNSKIFIGKNSSKYSNYSKPYTGSAILICTKPNNYIFIGTQIRSFKTKEPIKLFYSIMSNGEVVYPFALSKNYAYIFNGANNKFNYFDLLLANGDKIDINKISPYDYLIKNKSTKLFILT